MATFNINVWDGAGWIGAPTTVWLWDGAQWQTSTQPWVWDGAQWNAVQPSIITLDAPTISAVARDGGDPCGTINYTITAGANNPVGTTYNVSRQVNGGAFSSFATGLSAGIHNDSTVVKTNSYGYKCIAHNADPLYVDSVFSNVGTAGTFGGAC